MHILELKLNHLYFYCPATGVCILNPDEQCNEDAKSLIGYWVDEMMYEPFLKNERLQAEFETYIQENEEIDQDFYFGTEELESFLTNFVAPNWVAYKITTKGFGCGGPICSTVYLLIDMDTTDNE